MSSEALPPRPSLDQLRRRAKELRDAARSGDQVALGRITARTSAATRGTVTLAAAQLTIAREHGYPSWPQLVAEVQARTAELGQRADEFLVASIRDWTGRAARMLARDPWLAGYDIRTAVILGDAARVREMLARDPGLATRPDARTGWTALHAACASRWHRLDPARADGLAEVVRLLLDAGADPNRLLESGLLGESRAQSPPVSPLSAAIEMQAGPELTGLLLEYGAVPDVPGRDGRTPYQQAVRTGQDQVAELLARHGASTVLSSADGFLAACRRADRTAATAVIAAVPDLAAQLTAEDHRTLTDAADHGHTEAVRLMLDLGFPPGTRSEQDDGATALHLAAAAGSTGTVRLLLDRGADIEARDTTWNSTPLEWAIVGSGMRLGHDPHPDWPATVGALLDAGASAGGVVLSPDDPKPPSPEVAALLRARGIPDVVDPQGRNS